LLENASALGPKRLEPEDEFLEGRRIGVGSQGIKSQPRSAQSYTENATEVATVAFLCVPLCSLWLRFYALNFSSIPAVTSFFSICR
jgi:hypothetical protein